MHGGPSGVGRQRYVLVPRGTERHFGAHGAGGRGRVSLRADTHALRGDDARALPAKSREPEGEQDVRVDAALIFLGVYGGGRLHLRRQMHSVRKEPRRKATQDEQPQDLFPDGTADGFVYGPARAPPPDGGGE